MRMLLHHAVCILNRDGQADPAHDRKIHDVITDIGDLFRLDGELFHQVFKGFVFVALSLVYQLDAKIPYSMPDDLRCASGDNGDLYAALLQHFHAMPIAGIKGLVFLAIIPDK